MSVGVIFDLDGTILDSMPIWDCAGEIYLKDMNLVAEPELGKIMFSMSMIEGAEFLKDRYCLSIDVDDVIAGINRVIQDFYLYQVQLKDGVEKFIQELNNAGIPMVIATSSDRQIAESALKRLQVMDYFECIFTCSEIGAGKLQPDIYYAAAKYLDTLPQNTWVFEDALYALQTAANAGFRTVGVYDNSSVDHTNEIKRLCDIYLEKYENIDPFIAIQN